MIKSLQKSFRRLRQRKIWKHSVLGGAFVIEITGRPGNWHAHIHAIIEAYWIDWHKLLKVWKEVSTSQGVYIQNIPIVAVINHLLKYLNPQDIPQLVEEQVAYALKGVRLFQPLGSWFATNKTYVKPLYVCKSCGAKSWLPDFLLYPKEFIYARKYAYD